MAFPGIGHKDNIVKVCPLLTYNLLNFLKQVESSIKVLSFFRALMF